MKPEPIATYLQDRGIGIVGESIFAYTLPPDLDMAIAIIPPLSGTPIDAELPGYRRGKFQVIVRTPTHQDGDTIARQIMSELTLVNSQIGPMSIKYIRPRHEPVVYPSSKGDLLETSVNYDAVYVMA